MGWEYDHNGDWHGIGGDTTFNGLSSNLTITFWMNVLSTPGSGAVDRFRVSNHGSPDIISPLFAGFAYDPSRPDQGLGAACGHEEGGSFRELGSCYPGSIDPAYKVVPGQWMWYAFLRFTSPSGLYRAYFGSRRAIIRAGDTHYTNPPINQAQAAFLDVGRARGVSLVAPATIIGPFSVWTRLLNDTELQYVANCRTAEIDQTSLVVWCKMQETVEDLSTYHWPVSTNGSPAYVPDGGCQALATGNDYALTST